MNIRKPTDYVTMFTTLDTLMAAQLPQMEMYCEIGRLVSGRVEKGAAVAASEYLQAAYPAAEGFSPRNLRRMRAFYAAYEKTPEIMRLAMHLGWTQNVAILEGCGSSEERAWYIRAALRFGWKKAKLLESIKTQAWRNSSLDEQAVSCYTGEKEVTRESECNEKDTLCVSWEYLPQPHGRVCDEGLGKKNWAGVRVNTTRVSNFFIEIRVVSYLESLAIQGFPFFCVWLMCIGKHQNCEDVFIRRHRYMNTAFRYSYFDMLLQTLAVSCISAFDGGEPHYKNGYTHPRSSENAVQKCIHVGRSPLF